MTVIDEFIARFSDAQKAELERIRKIVHAAVPDAEEVITYGIPGFKYKGKYLVGFCAYKKHLSLFPASAPVEAFKDRLEGYKVSKGTIQFTLEKPMPESLIKDIVLSRLGDIVKALG